MNISSIQREALTTDVFKDRLNFLKHSQFWDKKEIDLYQTERIKELVEHCYNHVPFYREFMLKNDLKPSDFNTKNDVRKFPLIDKKIIQNNYRAFIPTNVEMKTLDTRTTGGSTGSPLTVYADLNFYSKDKANTEYYMSVFGQSIFSGKSIRLYGDKIEGELIEKNIFWRLENNRKLVMSCYHVNTDSIYTYLEKINDFQPSYIHTRPSSIFLLSKLADEQKLIINKGINYIFCDGEYLTKGQREMIERVFHCRVINIFGHTEGCLVGHPCMYSNNLHFMPQVGMLELIDASGNEVEEVGKLGEMVATGFNNFNFPLIRYRTYDMAVKGSNATCQCLRNYPLIQEVEGRVQDYVLNAYGNVIPIAPAIFNYNDMDWIGVEEFRVIQKVKGEILLLVKFESSNSNKSSTLIDIQKGVALILGDGMTVHVKEVHDLSKTKIGKYRYLEQHLDLSNYLLLK